MMRIILPSMGVTSAMYVPYKSPRAPWNVTLKGVVVQSAWVYSGGVNFTHSGSFYHFLRLSNC